MKYLEVFQAEIQVIVSNLSTLIFKRYEQTKILKLHKKLHIELFAKNGNVLQKNKAKTFFCQKLILEIFLMTNIHVGLDLYFTDCLSLHLHSMFI